MTEAHGYHMRRGGYGANSTVAIREREHQTALLRGTVKDLTQRCRDAEAKSNVEAVENRRLRGMLATAYSDKAVTAFAKLDDKHQALRLKHRASLEQIEELTATLNDTQHEAALLEDALEMNLEEYNVRREDWEDKVKVAKMLASRDEAVATLQEKYTTAEKEGGELAEKLAYCEEDGAEMRALLATQQEKLQLLADEVRMLGDSKDDLVTTLEQSSAENALLHTRVETLEQAHSDATEGARLLQARLEASETERKKMILHNEVAEKRLMQSREKLQEVNTELEEQRLRLSPKTLDEARAALCEVTLRAETLAVQNTQLSASLAAAEHGAVEATHLRTQLQDEVATLRAALQRAEKETAEVADQLRSRAVLDSAAVATLTTACERAEEEKRDAVRRLKQTDVELRHKRSEAERLAILSSTRQSLRRASQDRPAAAPLSPDASDPDLVANAFSLATTQPCLRVEPGGGGAQQHSFAISDITRSPQSVERVRGGGGGGGGGGLDSRTQSNTPPSPSPRREKPRNKSVVLDDIARHVPQDWSG